MSKKITLFIIFLCAFGGISWGQIVLQGKVVNATNDDPLVGAFVNIKGLDLYAVTEANGAYQLILPTPSQPKTMVVTITSLGFSEINQAIELLPIDDGETLIRNFSLEVDPLTLRDVTVTANRVEEEMQDVPVSVSVMDSKNLEVRSVATTEDAMEGIPNLIMGGFLPSRPSISLRGLSSDLSNTGIENSVGLYVDDVFQSRSYSFNSTLMDIERVEVLRGPQGTLFGKNTIGGLIHLIPEKAKFSNFGAVELNAGNFRYFQVRAKANVELIPEKLAWRTTGAYRQRDGWLLEKNPDVSDENGIQFFGGRTSLRYQPNKNLEIVLTGAYAQDDKADFRDDHQSSPSPAGGRFERMIIPDTETDPNDRRSTQNEQDRFFNRKDLSLSGKMNLKLGKSHTLTAVTGFNDSENFFIRDFDATSADAVFLARGAELKSFSQEIRIATPRKNKKFSYIGGVYFLQDEVVNDDSIALKGGMAPVWRLALGNPNIPDSYFEYATINSSIESSSFAAFVSGSVELSERIRLNAGIRFTHEEKSIKFLQSPFSPFNILSALVAAPLGEKGNPLRKSVTNDVFSGNVGMDFKTTDKILIYVNFSRGFKGAGYNISFSPDADPEKGAFQFDPEFVNNYELGLKLKMNNRYLFNAAAFVTDFRDKQELVAVGTSIFVSNAESIQGIGFEGEFTGIWNNFFKTDVSMGVMNLKYLNFPFIQGGQEVNLSGNRALKAPNFNFKFAPEFHTPLGNDLKLVVRADYNYVGKVYNDIFNSEDLARQATGILNARIAFLTKNERYSIALWGRNLTDELFYEHGARFVFGDNINPNPPRTMGMELRVNFY